MRLIVAGLGFYQLMDQLARERLIIGTLCAALTLVDYAIEHPG